MVVIRILVGALWLSLSAQAATAHSILTFDHAVPAVGGKVRKGSVRDIRLYFTAPSDSSEVEVRLRCSTGLIRLKIVASENRPMIVEQVKEGIPTGACYVSWKLTDDDWWNTYHFTAE